MPPRAGWDFCRSAFHRRVRAFQRNRAQRFASPLPLGQGFGQPCRPLAYCSQPRRAWPPIRPPHGFEVRCQILFRQAYDYHGNVLSITRRTDSDYVLHVALIVGSFYYRAYPLETLEVSIHRRRTCLENSPRRYRRAISCSSACKRRSSTASFRSPGTRSDPTSSTLVLGDHHFDAKVSLGVPTTRLQACVVKILSVLCLP